MDVKKIAAGFATAGVLGLGGFGAVAGLAQADPASPPPHGPGSTDHPGDPGGNGQGTGNPGPRPTTVTGPGVNAGDPGTPLPPGLGYLPPPGHGGPMPQDRIAFPEAPSWVTTPVTPPEGTPPAPELPDWAEGLPVVWNPDLGVWGVWDSSTGTFVRL
ncbi:hypothetical protein ASG82_07160 [Mycobacterium sp. Soil538]|nr:hypothetical protein ASG82_07160 [Mycobacterium sp. Soil538]